MGHYTVVTKEDEGCFLAGCAGCSGCVTVVLTVIALLILFGVIVFIRS